jgi:hypothetical protein
MLAWLAADGARAEALPGRFEAVGGGHFMLLASKRCSNGAAIDLSGFACDAFPMFAGIDLALRAQLGPSWFSLAARAAGSRELNPESGQPYATCSTFASVCLPMHLDRGLWLVRGSIEARFDPPVWPRAFWIGLEVGAAVAIATGHYTDPRGLASSSGIKSDPATRTQLGFLAGVGLGWDLQVSESVLVGVDLRAQMMLVSAAGSPSQNVLDVNLNGAPYFTLGAYAGYSW